MELTIERFDLDPSAREPNTVRRTPTGAPFPTDFPFVVDTDEERVVEPIALHLANKFNGNQAYLGALWTKANSADAAAADLKAWWAFIHEHPAKPAWDDISDRVLAAYLQALTRAPSDYTQDFLKPETIKRHCSSIDAFNDFARVRWPDGRFPSMDAAKILAGVNGRRKEHPTDEVPHPLTKEHVRAVNEKLGPMPSQLKKGQSSRLRLAWALAVHTGMRIDEIMNLPAALFSRLQIDAARPMKATVLELQITKGLVRRDIHFPNWLVLEMQAYIRGERTESLDRGRRLWIKTAEEEPRELLLNHPDAPGRNAGKTLTADTVEAAFNKAMKDLKILVPRQVMTGTDKADIVDMPRHVFHDGRHTFAHWTFGGMLDDGHRVEAAWMLLKLRLGHSHVKTTIDTYLKAFSEVPESTVDKLVEHLALMAEGMNP